MPSNKNTCMSIFLKYAAFNCQAAVAEVAIAEFFKGAFNFTSNSHQQLCRHSNLTDTQIWRYDLMTRIKRF